MNSSPQLLLFSPASVPVLRHRYNILSQENSDTFDRMNCEVYSLAHDAGIVNDAPVAH